MKQRANLWKIGGFLALLLVPLFIGGYKKILPLQNLNTPGIGVLDLDRAIRAHSRYSEVQKLDQEIAQRKAEAARGSAPNAAGFLAGGAFAGIAGQETTAIQQSFAQQIDAKMSEKQKEIGRALEAKVNAEKQELNKRLGEYAKEVDKEYKPLMLSIQLKMQSVQMTPEEREALKNQLTNIQEQRAQKIGKQQEVWEQELRQKLSAEQNIAEAQLRQFHTKLVAEANGQLDEKRKEIELRRTDPATGSPSIGSSPDQEAAKIKALEDQRKNLIEVIMQELKNAAAKLAARQNLELVLIKYQQNIKAVDITDAVIDAIKVN